MSFINKLRRALGFDDDSIFENEPGTSVLADDYDEIKSDSPAPAAASPAVPAPAQATVEAIFTHVVAQFNEALPDFLARSVDPEQQKKLLYENLERGIKDYLRALESDADSRCEARWSSEQATLRSEMDTLRQKAAQIEHQRADIKERQLSADRQKRALSERMRDLENQVGRLEAEREQYDLENKSLLNKLKVLAVQNPDLDIAAIGSLPSVDNEELDALRKENHTLKEDLDKAANQLEIANELYNDEHRRLKAAMRDIEDLKAITEQVEVVRKAIADRDTRIERQREKIRDLKQEIETLKSEAARSAEECAAKISQLQEQLAAQMPPTAIEIEEYEAAPSPEEVEAVASAPAAGKKQARKRKHRTPRQEEDAPRISDADLMDVEAGFAGSDWFGSAEPEPREKADKTDRADDFGYHAPEPKPRPYDDGMQMSLFD
ncbi:MAG: hypothetical protein K2L21_06425 [Muribaculaceae bacterium]|nr:hypothetical protein [Muribaculaceae bacterium]